MEVVGEEGISMEDLIHYLKSELYDFCYLQQNAFDPIDAYCPLERQVPLFLLINEIFDKHFEFSTRDRARSFFLTLQSKIKNLNSLAFESEEYKKGFHEIEEMVESARGEIHEARVETRVEVPS
jgi:V/A-type H+-transporting ATPase subunit A